MSFLYYFKDCPTCKNKARNLVREVALHTDTRLDERYIFALPDVWGKAVEAIGTPVPFIYDTDTGQSIHINPNNEDMRQQITAFLEQRSPAAP